MKQHEIKKFLTTHDPEDVLNWMIKDASQEEQHAAYELIMDAALTKATLPNKIIPKPTRTLQPKRPREA